MTDELTAEVHRDLLALVHSMGAWLSHEAHRTPGAACGIAAEHLIDVFGAQGDATVTQNLLSGLRDRERKTKIEEKE